MNRRYKMKKNLLKFTILLSCCLAFTSCGSQKKESSSSDISNSSSETVSTQLEEYKDDTISCLYDKSILKKQETTPNNQIKYGVTFLDDISNAKNDILNGTCLYVATQSHTIPYDDTKKFLLPAMTESLFNGIFKIETIDSTKITELEDNAYEYISQIDGIEYYGKLFYIDDSEMTISVCRILPDESQDYKNALKNCYESIQYIKENDSLNSVENDAENYKEITSGSLYNAIKKIDNNLYILMELKDFYSVSLISDNPTEFFSSCEKIFKNVFKKNKSVSFSMVSNEEDDIASLTVIKNNNNKSFKTHASLVVYDKTQKAKITSSYSKNKYWQSIDLDNLSNKAFEEITNKYK